MKKFILNKEAWCVEKNISGRKSVFLDTFAWSKIIRKEELIFVELRKLLTYLVQEKKIFIAVNLSLIQEIVERDDKEQAKDIIQLFDTLTDGIFLQNKYTLFPKELEEKVLAELEKRNNKQLSPNTIFGPLWEVVDEAYLAYKEPDRNVDEKTAELIFD